MLLMESGLEYFKNQAECSRSLCYLDPTLLYSSVSSLIDRSFQILTFLVNDRGIDSTA